MKDCVGCEGDLLVRVLYPPTPKTTEQGAVEVNSWLAGPTLCDGCATCMTLEGRAAEDDLAYAQCVFYDTDLRDQAPRRQDIFVPPQQPLERISYRFQELRQHNPKWSEEYNERNRNPLGPDGKKLGKLLVDAYHARSREPSA